FDSLEKLSARTVFVAGKLLAERGKMLEPVTAPSIVPPRDTVRLQPLSPNDFVLKAPVNNGRARLRHIKGARFTQWSEVEVEVIGGEVQLPEGFSLIWVQHRHGRHEAKPQLALLEGWG